MGDFNKQICRLCLVISPTCECETIDEIKKEILHVLQINMDFEVSNCAVACNRCLERLHDCFDFKSRITTLMEDIKKTSQREMIGESLCMEKLQGCQLCMSLIKEDAYNYTTDLKGAVLLEDMIRNCFAEVDLNTHVHESHTCKQCVRSLERHYEFMKCCQEVEQKIVHFRQVANHCSADKVNLEHVLKFKDCYMLGTPLIIKKECSDNENVDENATKCPTNEDIASIKCEEIHIKDDGEDEDDNGLKTEDYGESSIHDNSGDSRSSEETTETRTSATKDNDVHECTLCSFITNTRLSLQAHMASHRVLTKKYGCRECKYETDHKSNLYRHCLCHKDNSEVKMHKCPSCPYKTKYKYNLMNHRKILHKNPQEIPKYKCEVCDFESKYKNNIAIHMQTHQDPKITYKFQCEKCPFKTKWKGNLKKHVIEMHDNPRVDYKFQCEKCPFNTKWKRNLERHVTGTHEDPKVAYKFQCEICPFKTKWKQSLERHVMTHHIEHIDSCDQGTFSTKVSMNLQLHEYLHQKKGKDRYKCKLCTYQARTTRSIRFHMIRTHTDPSEVSKLKCTRCPNETVYKHHLLTHMRGRHDIENQPKLKCDLCNFVTTKKKYMQQHLIVHREATMQCYHCDFQTKWKSYLQKHMKQHQAGSCFPTKQQTIPLRSNKNRNGKKIRMKMIKNNKKKSLMTKFLSYNMKRI